MNSYTRQKEEIETIRERAITLKLSDADVKRITEKSASVGLTVSELLESFIGDLVDGTYSNGSDERMLAGEWFERCGFSFEPLQTFLVFLLEWGNLQTILDTLEYIEELEADKETATEEELEEIEEELSFQQKEIRDYYREYETTVRKPQPYEEALESIQAYKDRLDTLRGGKV